MVKCQKLKKFNHFRLYMHYSKRAQIEILGIAVVILVLLAGTIFFINLIPPLNSRSVVVDVARTEIGANTLNTLLKTTTPCKQLKISELITDCVDGAAISCSTQNSCEYLQGQIGIILEQTLAEWGIDYQFDILELQDADYDSKGLEIKTKTCKTYEHYEQILPTQITLAKASLDLC